MASQTPISGDSGLLTPSFVLNQAAQSSRMRREIYMDDLVADSPLSVTLQDDAGALGAAVIQAIIPLLGLDRASDVDTGDLAEDRMRAISRYVRSRVRPFEDGPSEAELCRRFGISRATLYRDLASVGGLKTFVSGIRLEQARRDLETATSARGVVRRVAERWGYYDPSHFNTAFSRKFGRSPSQVIGALTAQGASWTTERATRAPADASLKDGLLGLLS